MQQLTCPHCRFTFDDSQSLWDRAAESGACPKCGKGLRDGGAEREQAKPEQAAAVGSYKFCTHCGTKLPFDARFCSACGAAATTPAAEEASSHVQERRDSGPSRTHPQRGSRWTIALHMWAGLCLANGLSVSVKYMFPKGGGLGGIETIVLAAAGYFTSKFIYGHLQNRPWSATARWAIIFGLILAYLIVPLVPAIIVSASK